MWLMMKELSPTNDVGKSAVVTNLMNIASGNFVGSRRSGKSAVVHAISVVFRVLLRSIELRMPSNQGYLEWYKTRAVVRKLDVLHIEFVHSKGSVKV